MLPGCAVELIAWAYSSRKTSLVAVNGQTADAYKEYNGITVASLNMTNTSCRINSTAQFEINLDSAAREFLGYLRSLPNGTIVVAATSRDVDSGKNVYAAPLKEMFNIDVSTVTLYIPFVFIGKIGDPSFTRFKLGPSNYGAVHLVEKLRPFPHGMYVQQFATFITFTVVRMPGDLLLSSTIILINEYTC